nr:hypothetical protein CFP56_79031 [Quercus suber]
MSLQFLAIALVERVVEEEEGCELAFLIRCFCSCNGCDFQMSFGTLEIRYNYYPILKLICTFLCDLRKIYFELFENKFYKTWLKL